MPKNVKYYLNWPLLFKREFSELCKRYRPIYFLLDKPVKLYFCLDHFPLKTKHILCFTLLLSINLWGHSNNNTWGLLGTFHSLIRSTPGYILFVYRRQAQKLAAPHGFRGTPVENHCPRVSRIIWLALLINWLKLSCNQGICSLS